jgi:Tfp pilus assembly protein PilO
MKVQMTPTNRLIVALLVLAAAAGAFWILLLSPKREEAKELGAEVERLEASLAQHEGEVRDAEEAREEFPVAYQQLVVLGKAVPGDDDTASLLVQLNGISESAEVRFSEFKLNSSGTAEAPPPPPPAPEGSSPEGSGGTPASTVSPTEAAASAMPLGAAIGPAGLAVMPYSLKFEGGFFALADFIKGLDSLVQTSSEQVEVDGRLITINGFSLSAGEAGFPSLEGEFSVTTYLTPPSQGVTGGATPGEPPPAAATPAATTTGGAP